MLGASFREVNNTNTKRAWMKMGKLPPYKTLSVTHMENLAETEFALLREYDTDTENWTDTDTETETEAEMEGETEMESETEIESESDMDSESEIDRETDFETETDSEDVADTEQTTELHSQNTEKSVNAGKGIYITMEMMTQRNLVFETIMKPRGKATEELRFAAQIALLFAFRAANKTCGISHAVCHICGKITITEDLTHMHLEYRHQVQYMNMMTVLKISCRQRMYNCIKRSIQAEFLFARERKSRPNIIKI